MKTLIVLVTTPYSGGREQRMFYICCHSELDLKAIDVPIKLPLLWLQQTASNTNPAYHSSNLSMGISFNGETTELNSLSTTTPWMVFW